MHLWGEIRRRNVHRVAIAYVAAAWLLIQVVETLFPIYGFSDAAIRAVVTILAVGFVPAVILSWVFEWTPEGLRRDSEVTSPASPAYTRRFDAAIIAILVLAVAYFAVDKFVLDPVRDREQIQAATTEAVEDALTGELLERYAHRSVLVLPFRNISPDPEQEYFADGIAEELLNLLTKIEELRVIPRATSWTLKGKQIDVAELSDKLGVSHILEGSVRKAGNQVRITAQLIDTRTYGNVWSESWDRGLDDIFAIQDEISAEVVSQLKLELLAGPPSAEEIDPVAYDLYLRGRHLVHSIRTAEVLDEAVELLSRSVELAPDYVPAIWDLARAIYYSRSTGSPDDVEAKEATIRELTDRLVELAPDSSYANQWLGFFAAEAGNLQEAALYRERALAAANDSHLYIMQTVAARFLGRLGRFEEAAVLALYVVDRDPACRACIETVLQVFRPAGKHLEAAHAMEKMLEWRDDLSPYLYWQLGVAWLVTGDPGKALEYFEQGPPGNRDMGRLMALHDLGRQDEFEAQYSKMISEMVAPEGIARVAAWTGQNDLAFEYLELAVEEYGPSIARTVRTDLYEPIKSDPRWQEYLERYGATDQEFSQIRFNPKLPAEVKAALAGR